MSGAAAADAGAPGGGADREAPAAAPAERRSSGGLHHAQGRQSFAAGSGAFGATQINARSADASGSAAAGSQEVPHAKASAQGSAAPSPNVNLSLSAAPSPSVNKSIGTPGSTHTGKWSDSSWSREERIAYVRSLEVVTLPAEEVILRFLGDAIAKAPLPSPWHMARDSQGRTFFANRSSGASTWTHPLEPSLRELAGVCRMCLTFPAALRESTISTLLETWQAEAKQELAKWYSVKHDNGREYYCHRETWEAMWEHPAEVVLPMHYLKIRSIERLRDEGYLTSLRNRDTVIKESPVPEAQAMTQKLTGVSIDTAAAESDAPTREATPKRDANSTSNRPVDQQAQQAPSGYPVDQKAEQQFSPQTTLAQPSGQIPLSQRTQGSVRRVPMSGTTSPEVTQTMYAKSKASTGRAPSREQSQGGQYQVRRMETPPQQMQKLREEAREHQLKEQQLRAELIEAKNQQLQPRPGGARAGPGAAVGQAKVVFQSCAAHLCSHFCGPSHS